MADIFRALRESGGLSALGSAMQSSQQASLQREESLFGKAVTLEKLNILKAGESRAAAQEQERLDRRAAPSSLTSHPDFLKLTEKSQKLLLKTAQETGATDEFGMGTGASLEDLAHELFGATGTLDDVFDAIRENEISDSIKLAADAQVKVIQIKDKIDRGESGLEDKLKDAQLEAASLKLKSEGIAGTFNEAQRLRNQARATREAATTKGKSGDIAKAQKRISDIGKAELSIRSGGSDDTIMAIMAKIDPTGAAKARLAAFDGPIADEAIRLLNVEKLQLINTLPTNLREHYISTEKVGESAPSLGSTAALRAAEGGAPIPQEGRELTPAEEKAMKEQGLEFTGRFSPDGKPIFLKDGREGTLK